MEIEYSIDKELKEADHTQIKQEFLITNQTAKSSDG